MDGHRRVSVVCSYHVRSHIVAFILEKYVQEIDVQYTQDKKSAPGFCNFTSLQEFLERVLPGEWNAQERLPLLGAWRMGMGYQELQEALGRLEPLPILTDEASPAEGLRALLFGLLYSETVFINLHRSGKLSGFPRVRDFFTKMSGSMGDTLHEFEQKKRREMAKDQDQASFDIGLPPSMKVITRFPPEPSGYLHIGHAKAALLNNYFAKQYHGRLIVRFDDTNPTKETEEYESSILEDLSTLQIRTYTLSRTSNYFDMLIKYAIILIEKGLAYCDDTDVDTMRQERDKGVPSKRRNSPATDNLHTFMNMQTTDTCNKFCVRAKIDMGALNKAMRDPVIYRIHKTPHHHTGCKYKIYPTYDFACPIVDSIEGVSLALRTSEYRDRDEQYEWFLSALDMENRPKIWDFSRLNFRKTLLSKRKLKWFVENKKVEGWDDPRMPTIRGIVRRGLHPSALTKYVISQGPSKNTVSLTWDKLWAMNAQTIDKISPRYHAVEDDDNIAVVITNLAQPVYKEVPLFPKDADLGSHRKYLSERILVSRADAKGVAPNDEVTLMGLANLRVHTVSAEEIAGELVEASPKTSKAKLTWVSSEKSVRFEMNEYDDLILTDKLEDDDLEKAANPHSKRSCMMVGDEGLREVRNGQTVQIEKRGFLIRDGFNAGGCVRFNLVPGTRQNVH